METGLDPRQLWHFVVTPCLEYLAPEIPYSVSAARLVLGTAMVESRLRYIDQTTPGPGPAYGLWQMEAPTLADHHRWLLSQGILDDKIRSLMAEVPFGAPQLWSNLWYACAMARVHYRRAPERIPDDPLEMANLWKLRYNTPRGKGTVAKAFPSFQTAVLLSV